MPDAQSLVMKDFTGGLWLNEGNAPDQTFAAFLENLDVTANGGLAKRAPLRKDITYAPVSPNHVTLPRVANGRQPWIIHPNDTTKFFAILAPGASAAAPGAYSSGTWKFVGFTKGNPVPPI